MGGEIALYQCVYDVVRNRLDERTSWRLESQDTLIQALLEVFRPSSIFVLLDILRRIEFRGQSTGNGSINVRSRNEIVCGCFGIKVEFSGV